MVQLRALGGAQSGVRAFQAGEGQRGTGALLGGRCHGQHAAKGFALVADLHAAITFIAGKAHAVAGCHFQLCGHGALRATRRRRSKRRPRCQAVRHCAQRVQRFNAALALHLFGGCGLEPRRRQAHGQCLLARGVFHKAQHGEQLGRFVRGQRGAPHLAGPHKACAFAAMVIDLQIVQPLAAHFYHFALAKYRLLKRGFTRGSTQHGAVAGDDGSR